MMRNLPTTSLCVGFAENDEHITAWSSSGCNEDRLTGTHIPCAATCALVLARASVRAETPLNRNAESFHVYTAQQEIVRFTASLRFQFVPEGLAKRSYELRRLSFMQLFVL